MPLEGKRILVTGGTGSLGKTLVRRLLTGEHGPPGADHRLLARRGQAARHAPRATCTAARRPTRSSTSNFASCSSFRIGDVRDYAASARRCATPTSSSTPPR